MTDMDSLTLRPSKKKWLLVLAGSIAFVVCGACLIYLDEPGSAVIGWSSILFFGLGIPISIAMLIPGLNALVLTPEGFSVKTFGRTKAIWIMRWQDIENFSVLQMRSSLPSPWFSPFRPRLKMVGLCFAAPARAKMPPVRIAKMDRLRLRFGCDGGLPDTYGLSAENLVALLNEWRTVHSC